MPCDNVGAIAARGDPHGMPHEAHFVAGALLGNWKVAKGHTMRCHHEKVCHMHVELCARLDTSSCTVT